MTKRELLNALTELKIKYMQDIVPSRGNSKRPYHIMLLDDVIEVVTEFANDEVIIRDRADGENFLCDCGFSTSWQTWRPYPMPDVQYCAGCGKKFKEEKTQ